MTAGAGNTKGDGGSAFSLSDDPDRIPITAEHEERAPVSAASPAPPAREVLMPRRPAPVERDIPLFLVPHIAKRRVRTHGEDPEQNIVRRAGIHFYHVSIRSRPIKRELKRKKKHPSALPGAATGEEEEKIGEGKGGGEEA